MIILLLSGKKGALKILSFLQIPNEETENSKVLHFLRIPSDRTTKALEFFPFREKIKQKLQKPVFSSTILPIKGNSTLAAISYGKISFSLQKSHMAPSI